MKLPKQPTRPSARFLSDTARCMQVLALSTVLSACGGGESGSSSKPAPVIPSVIAITPTSATVNVPVTLTVTGQNLPLTAIVSMADAACQTPTAQTATGFSATCTATTTGGKVVTVQTNTAANGGTVIDRTHSIDVVASILPDTGITSSQCNTAGSGNVTSNVLVSCTSAAAIALNDKQDGMLGRDVEHADNSDGKLGFSYTKLDASGNVLPASATNWSCIKDNLTGLTWEVKTADGGGLRDMIKTYTNYDDMTKAQKYSGSAWVNPTQAEIDAPTNTRGFVAAVNASGLCGHADWRLPSADELQSIVDYGVASSDPMVDGSWFINTRSRYPYWSSSSMAGYARYAWVVHSGSVTFSYRDHENAVRLVR